MGSVEGRRQRRTIEVLKVLVAAILAMAVVFLLVMAGEWQGDLGTAVGIPCGMFVGTVTMIAVGDVLEV